MLYSVSYRDLKTPGVLSQSFPEAAPAIGFITLLIQQGACHINLDVYPIAQGKAIDPDAAWLEKLVANRRSQMLTS